MKLNVRFALESNYGVLNQLQLQTHVLCMCCVTIMSYLTEGKFLNILLNGYFKIISLLIAVAVFVELFTGFKRKSTYRKFARVRL